MKNKKAKKTWWVAADARAITVRDLGDKHLVNILNMIETNSRGRRTQSGMLPPEHLLQYDVLVSEGIRRGLFSWNNDRKYVNETMELIRVKTNCERD